MNLADMNDVASIRRRQWEKFSAQSQSTGAAPGPLEVDRNDSGSEKKDQNNESGAIPSEFECILCLR